MPVSSPSIHLAATPWSGPPLLQVFFIDPNGRPAEFVYQDGVWVKNPRPSLPPILATVPGGPISANQGVRNANGEEFVEVFYASDLSIVNLVRKLGKSWMVGDFGEDVIWSLPSNTDGGISMADRLSLGFTIGYGTMMIILALLALKGCMRCIRKFCSWFVDSMGRRLSEPLKVLCRQRGDIAELEG